MKPKNLQLLFAAGLVALAAPALFASASVSPASSGAVTNSAEWFDAADPSRAVAAFGSDRHVDGWMFFGGGKVGEFGDTSQRAENLPAYIETAAVTAGARTANFPGYSAIPLPEGKGSMAGTLTLSDAGGLTE